jgi:hypothetical protein
MHRCVAKIELSHDEIHPQISLWEKANVAVSFYTSL